MQKKKAKKKGFKHIIYNSINKERNFINLDKLNTP